MSAEVPPPSRKPFARTSETRTSSAGRSPGFTTRPAPMRGLVTSRGSMVHTGAEGRVAAAAARAASKPSHAAPEAGWLRAAASRARAVRSKVSTVSRESACGTPFREPLEPLTPRERRRFSRFSSRRRAALLATYVSPANALALRLATTRLSMSFAAMFSLRARSAQRSAARPKTVAGVDALSASSASATRRLATTGASPTPVSPGSYEISLALSSSASRAFTRDA